MLVCNVSLRAPRGAIAASITETATAVDATATGNVVFATLVDDPASVGEIVDAYLGEIILEAASASDAVDAGLAYSADILEEVTATAAYDGAIPAVYTDAIAEATTASDTFTASVGAATAVTTTSVGKLLMPPFDTTFPSSSLTVIDAGR